MKILNNDDTIAAIATPAGVGGIAIIRISGNKALDILHHIFSGKIQPGDINPWRVYLGKIKNETRILDQVLVTYFRKPNSYTREDMIEISCHGGIYISKKILELIIQRGARLAEPGEFTKRAFLNGRIDLSQAEAVADLIHAKTESNFQVSLQHLEGRLHLKIKDIQEELIDICSLLEVQLDFSEEDIDLVNKDEIINRIKKVIFEIEKLIISYNKGKIFLNGVRLIIIGKPNVGKSSLLNALLREDRAIVTEIPGTTRDILEDQLDIKGILFRTIDTAGITETKDIVEQYGIERTLRHLDSADIIIHVFDNSKEIDEDDRKIIRKVLETQKTRKNKIIIVLNKIDLMKKLNIDNIQYSGHNFPISKISALKYKGIDKLEQLLFDTVIDDKSIFEDNSSEIVITKTRHQEALKRALIDLKNSLSTFEKQLSLEFVTIDLRNALDNIGEIIGTVTSEDILNNIFNSFCIGK